MTRSDLDLGPTHGPPTERPQPWHGLMTADAALLDLFARVERVASPRGDAVIAWSMGSLISNYGAQWRGLDNPSPAIERVLVDPATRDVALMRAQFERMDDGRLSLVTLTANALWMQHGEEGVRVLPLRLLETDLRRARARAVGEALGPAVRVRE